MFNGKIHYFDWAIFNSYAKLPEGIHGGRYGKVFVKNWMSRELGNIWQCDVPNDFATLGNIGVEAT